jgi:hypothetical protein
MWYKRSPGTSHVESICLYLPSLNTEIMIFFYVLDIETVGSQEIIVNQGYDDRSRNYHSRKGVEFHQNIQKTSEVLNN